MKKYAYLFEAKSIQGYILDSGRMRDLTGASELVDALTTELLPATLKSLGFEDEFPIRFSRRAGGAIYGFTEDKDALDSFAGLWSLLVQQYAPGLVFDIGRGEGDTKADAFENARNKLRADASRVRPVLPVMAPITRRSARTGNAGFVQDNDGLTLDLPTKRKRVFNSKPKAGAKTGLWKRFSPAPPDPAEQLTWDDWPRDLTPGKDGAFPYLGEDHTVALIHADGNGLGQLLRKADDAAKHKRSEYVAIFRGLSDAIKKATQEAARHATARVLISEREHRRKLANDARQAPLAARPIVLGGDDLTILIRADLALPFLYTFLEGFEEESRARLPGLGIGCDGLTAGAGVVFMRASQPFYLATDLAESLMKLAKTRAKAIDPNNPPSALAFHRVTNSMIEDYEEIVEREKTNRFEGVAFVNTLGSYALRADRGLPAIAELFALQEVLENECMSRGPTRQLHTLMGLAPNQAETAYQRWRELMGDEANERRALLREYDNLFAKLVGEEAQPHAVLPFAEFKGEYRSPLGDALTLMAVKSKIPEDMDHITDMEDAE